MDEWDIHSYPMLCEYIDLCIALSSEKDNERKKKICYRMIQLLPECHAQQKVYSSKKVEYMKDWHKSIGEIHDDDYYKRYVFEIPKTSPFKPLAIMYEKEGNFSQAIAICYEAISSGFEDDGTKAGMEGRIKKLEKKMEDTILSHSSSIT